MDTFSSNQAVSRFLQGDESAFEELVHGYTPALYAFLFLMTRERELTEDIIQDTFLKVWKHHDRFDQNQSFKTWLYTIAKRTAFDALKKKKPLLFSELDTETAPLVEMIPDGHPSSLEELTMAEGTRVLEEALAHLPLRYRTLLLLVYREDFSLREAAEILGESYNTIKSRHQRGIRLLRQSWGDQNASGKPSEAY